MGAVPKDASDGQREVLVVGAGAAGLWAAARAAELGARVRLLEKTPRVGTKVLASGGTRCNLTTTLGAEEAGRLFGERGERFLRRALRVLPPEEIRRRFASLGVPTREAPLEKVFPVSGKARDVRDALLTWATRAGVRVRTGVAVRSVERGECVDGEGAWRLRLEDGSTAECERLILAPGGMSFPKTGTTGDGYAWLRSLDLELVPPVPALVPLTSDADWVHDLAGISLQETTVRLFDREGKPLGERTRPVVFTHHGISGPGAMDLSEAVARAAHSGQAGDGARCVLRMDCAPGRSREELRADLLEATGIKGSPRLQRVLARVLETPLPRRLVAAVARQAELDEENPAVHALGRASRHRLIESLRGLDVPISGTLGFDRAEVTAGGLALSELDPGTMAVRGRSGLFVIGEILDVQGPIGGLNFLAAFATAELAALKASEGARGTG